MWDTCRGLQWSIMDVSATGEVLFLTGSDIIDDETFERSGTLKGNTLTLSSPVEAQGVGKIKSLHYVVHNAREYFVSGDDLEDFDDDKSRFGSRCEYYSGLRRRRPKETLEKLALSARDEGMRVGAIQEWSLWPQEMADVAFLLRVLRNDSSEEVRGTVVYHASFLGRGCWQDEELAQEDLAKESVKILEEAVHNEKSKAVRLSAIEWFGHLPAPGAERVLWRAFRQANDPQIRYAAAVSLGQNGVVNSEVFDVVIAGLTDERIERISFSDVACPIGPLIQARYEPTIAVLEKIAASKRSFRRSCLDSIRRILTRWHSPKAKAALERISELPVPPADDGPVPDPTQFHPGHNTNTWSQP